MTSSTPESQRQTRADLLALLAWYQAAGVDVAVADTPVAWLGAAGHTPGAGFHWPQGDVGGAAPATGRSTADATATPPITRSDISRAPPAPADRKALETDAVARQPHRPPSSPTSSPDTGTGLRPGAMSRGFGSNDRAHTPPARFATGAPEAAELAARQLVSSVADMASLKAALEGFDGCALKATAKTTCVWRGAERARVMIIGEAPGRDEDLAGQPFVGRAGQLLDRMLAAIDLDETSVHITNIVYWRPPGNRTPTPQETQICRPFLERQVELVQPEIILLLGGAAAKTVLDTADGIMRLRGKWREVTLGSVKLQALATLHPAYLLRTPAAKRMAWRDLLTLKNVINK